MFILFFLIFHDFLWNHAVGTLTCIAAESLSLHALKKCAIVLLSSISISIYNIYMYMYIHISEADEHVWGLVGSLWVSKPPPKSENDSSVIIKD